MTANGATGICLRFSLTFCFFLLGLASTNSHAQDLNNETRLQSVLVSNLSNPNQLRQQQKAAETLDPAKVRKAISDGILYLKSKQRKNGSWSRIHDPGDVTALCALAMLNAGLAPNDASVKRALKHIRDQKTIGTYFVALRIMAFAAGRPPGKNF